MARQQEGRLDTVRWAALAMFVAVPVFSWLTQPLAGRIVWTVAVPALPLFITLVGFHRWRRICPLASLAQLPRGLHRPGTRRASAYLRANYYYVAFSIFLASLWLRLVATNGDGRAIAVFFVVLSLAAIASGALYTGKTWCNFICPVSFIEKIYTEPVGLRTTSNSQCSACTGCKGVCPDINQETAYWSEIGSPAKRFVYFAFPGVVFGFYLYYYLQSGTWDYYFDGTWTDERGVIATAFIPGHDAGSAGLYFLPQVSRAVGAFLTLAVCSTGSFLLFSHLERRIRTRLRRRDAGMDDVQVRHLMFAIAAFVAFVIFYSFAGAPTLRQVPWLQHLWVLAVVAVASFALVRRLGHGSRFAPMQATTPGR